MTIWIGDLKMAEGAPAWASMRSGPRRSWRAGRWRVSVDLNQGTAEGVAWGCDLSYDYVRINANYRT